jgi:hypothetical protein
MRFMMISDNWWEEVVSVSVPRSTTTVPNPETVDTGTYSQLRANRSPAIGNPCRPSRQNMSKKKPRKRKSANEEARKIFWKEKAGRKYRAFLFDKIFVFFFRVLVVSWFFLREGDKLEDG